MNLITKAAQQGGLHKPGQVISVPVATAPAVMQCETAAPAVLYSSMHLFQARMGAAPIPA